MFIAESVQSVSSVFQSVQSFSRVRFFVTPWIAASQASLSITKSRSLLKLMSIESVMPSSHLILCHPLLLLPPIPPSIRVFSNESILFFFFCSEFCHTLKWNSHGFTCVPHPDPRSHLPLHPLPLGLPSASGPSTCLMHPTWAGFTLDNIHVSMLFSWTIPPSPSPTESKRLFYKSVSFFFLLFCIQGYH